MTSYFVEIRTVRSPC